MSARTDVVLDIETVPAFAETEWDDDFRAYLARRKVTPERYALEPGLLRVVAVGLMTVGGDDPQTWYDDGGFEAELLAALAYALNLHDRPIRHITYNGRGFDLPALAIRALQLGVDMPINPVPYRYDLSEHCDLADVLSWYGGGKMWSLDYWLRVFGLPPKVGSGADVAGLVAAGEWDRLREYVRSDVLATAALYERVRPMLRHFKGGE